MPESNEYDDIIAHAHRIGKIIHEPYIVGLSLPDDFSWPLISSSVPPPSDSWHPFSNSTVKGSCRILLLPDNHETQRKQAIRTLKQLKAIGLILITPCMGLKEQFPLESFVKIVDHIGLSGNNPLSGPNDERIGPRYPNMIHAYDKIWLGPVDIESRLKKIHLQNAIYACVKNSTTPAEDKMLTCLGADVVGHEVVDDVIIANHCGLPVTALGYIDSYPLIGNEKQTGEDLGRFHAQQGRINQLLCRIFDTE